MVAVILFAVIVLYETLTQGGKESVSAINTRTTTNVTTTFANKLINTSQTIPPMHAQPSPSIAKFVLKASERFFMFVTLSRENTKCQPP